MKLILHFLKPYKRLCLFTLVTMILDVAGGLLIPTITAGMINTGVAGGDLNQIIQDGIFMLAVALLTSAGALAGSWCCASLSAKMGRDIRNRLYEHSLAFSSHDFGEFGTGSMITRTLNDINIIQQSFVWCIQMVLPVPVICIMGIVMAFSLDTQMGFLMIASTLIIILLAVLVTRKASAIFERLQKLLDRMNVILRENLTGVRVIRAFHKEPHEEKRMRKSFEDYAETAIRANRLFAGLESVAMLIINLCCVAILWFGGNRVGAGFMEIGDITALTQYAILILFYIVMAQMVLILLPRARTCTRRVQEVLSRQPEISDRSNILAKSREKQQEIIQFNHVTFRFADAEEDSLHDISFSCNKGETTAIIGSTGSGKSTIAKLMLRFHEVTSGFILFNGTDIREVSQQSLRDRIAYVPQKAWLFSGTVADNLRYGQEDASPSEMEAALAVAQADFALELPYGLNAPVSQGGTNFSGGQKQRLSIARALMKKADLYIFDDSFSALDFKTDAALRKALIKETKDAAVFIIAQRINTILNAHQIIVLEDGRIVGTGTHDFLMKNCPVYQDIAKSQMKGDDTLG
ncbi:MAG: ABC transporter ATP-binding protein [Ruminococcus sp.]|jgi:ATP-binding cassette subfamily B multidrug efflux pump